VEKLSLDFDLTPRICAAIEARILVIGREKGETKKAGYPAY